MKVKHGLILFWIIVFTWASGAIYAQETMWVTSTGAKLKADKTASSDTIEELSVGAELGVEKTDGKWYFVKTASDKKGWIYRGKISDTKLENTKDKEDEGIAGFLGDVTGSQIQANASDTSRSMRGLSPEAKEYAKAAGTSEECQTALDKVLTKRVSQKEIEGFLKSANIGEYAQ